MGMSARIASIFGAKANKALDRLEDPRETLDYSYEKQLELLQQTRRGLADVTTARVQLENQTSGLKAQADKLQEQAQQAVAIGREDIARDALTRRAALVPQLQALDTQHQQLEKQEAQLKSALDTLTQRVQAFKTQKETLKATYTAAQAQVKINESVAGLTNEHNNVGLALERAQDRVAQMQARAGALDALIVGGDLPVVGGDDIAAQLAAAGANNDIELELARLKGELPAAPAPVALEAAPSAAPSAAPVVDAELVAEPEPKPQA